MKQIPQTEHAIVLRTDFSDQAAWDDIRAEIQKPVGSLRFRAYVEFLDDPAYADIPKVQLHKMIPQDYRQSFIIVADRTAMEQPEHPLLILDLSDKPARAFRAVPKQIQGIENNLSIANMDFEEFADSVDEDGVFRGFPEDQNNPWRA
jgi:hypothetical protein